ncbi:dystroglycan-like [Dorcoceras hygrometricum]|uniref:Dystroglycan-like n=1 Tax=Dorcoceras hygrometricum TaxID=472368 RepID=A0A2Z7DET9_9LAMI|nr:dystroglycan-like [Dorcoceras hygrometricum]
MAASFFVNAMQVDFASVLAMEHTGMDRMFKTLEETGLKGFLTASGSVYESAVVDFFANATVIVGTIVSFIANRKLALPKEVFSETFGLPTKGMESFLDISNQTMVEMRGRFSGSDVPSRAPSKKKEMKIEYRLMHDIVAKALCAKAGSFVMVTSEKSDLMVAITAGLKVNWAQLLFQVLTAMVNNPTRQSQGGFAVQLSVLLERLVKADLGESVKIHRQKVLTNKSVNTYIKKNLGVGQAGDTSKVSGATASELYSTAYGPHAIPKEPEKAAFMKHDFNTYKHTFYEKMDKVAANVSSSQISLETSLVRQFTEHQLQIASDIDFVKLQLAELVNHLKEIGDAKKGEGGQSALLKL